MDKSNGQSQGQGRANGQLQPPRPQSKYFQSFDASQFTHPSSGRRPHPTYTAAQKDEAIHLLNEGFPSKMVVGQIGGSCSKANPYRWCAEEAERERQRQAEAEVKRVRRLEVEAEQRERVLQRQRVYAAQIRREQINWWGGLSVVLGIQGLALILIQSKSGFYVWCLWSLIIPFVAAGFGNDFEEVYGNLQAFNIVFLWEYVLLMSFF